MLRQWGWEYYYDFESLSFFPKFPFASHLSQFIIRYECACYVNETGDAFDEELETTEEGSVLDAPWVMRTF